MRQDQREAVEKIQYPDVEITTVGQSLVYMQDRKNWNNFRITCVLAGWSVPETVNEITKICNKLKGVKE